MSNHPHSLPAALTAPSQTDPSDFTLAAPLPHRPLVAVLPFAPAGSDPSLRLLGNDIADLLRERMGQDPDVQAILISSDFLAKAPPHAVELICRELGVGHLVCGQCHGSGSAGAPSLYVELTDTRDWHIRWAHFYRGNALGLLAHDGVEMAGLVGQLRRALVAQRRRRVGA